MSAPVNVASALPSRLSRAHLRHLITGRDETVHLAVPERALADRENVRVGGSALIVDHDAAALAHRKSGGARRSHRAGRMPAENTIDVGLRAGVPSANFSAMTLRFRRRTILCRVLARVNADAELGDLLSQHAAAALIDLHRHQARREFDDVRRQPEILQRLRRFEPEQPATDDDADLAVAGRRTDRFEIFDRAIDETARAFACPESAARRGMSRSPGPACRTRASRPCDGRDALRRRRSIAAARSARCMVDRHACRRIRSVDERQVVRALAGEKSGQLHAVVRSARLFAQHRDVESSGFAVSELLEQSLTDHAVADDDQFLSLMTYRVTCSGERANRESRPALGRIRWIDNAGYLAAMRRLAA